MLQWVTVGDQAHVKSGVGWEGVAGHTLGSEADRLPGFTGWPSLWLTWATWVQSEVPFLKHVIAAPTYV